MSVSTPAEHSRDDLGAGPAVRVGSTKRRVREFDGLRAVAVLAVLAFHTLPAALPGGGSVGVLVFFVLSGYLITGALLDEWSRIGRVELRRFYARRLARLFPPMAAVVVAAMFVPGGPPADALVGSLAGMAYLTNLAAFVVPGMVPVATRHLWSLATEEQFYLGWPLALAALGRPGRAVRPAVRAVAAALAAVAVGFASTAVDRAAHPAYYLPTIWAQTLVIGGVAAYLVVTGQVPRLVLAVAASSWVAALAAGLLVYAMLDDLQSGMIPVLAVASVLVVVNVSGTPASPLGAVLRLPALVALGRWSYSLYLVHPLVLVAVHHTWGDSPVPDAVAVALALGAAWLLHRGVERPALRWKGRFAPRPTS